jgi:hypothetical protein
VQSAFLRRRFSVNILICIFCFPVLAFAQTKFDHSDWDGLLKKYVHNGLVDYRSFQESHAVLGQYFEKVEKLPAAELGELGREERIAFWINVYNASVVRLVLDSYPIARFDEIPAVFEIRTTRVSGEFFSLAEFRDDVLRRGFRDERILTALASGTLDSPKLFNEAFQGETLDEQLNRAARLFVEDDTRNQIVPGKKKIFISPLFDEFGPDFLINYGVLNEESQFNSKEAAVISFLLHHLQNPGKRLFLDSGEYKIKYLPRNLVLNDANLEANFKVKSKIDQKGNT